MDRTAVDPDDLAQLSTAHQQLGADIGSRSQPDPELAVGLPDGFGKVGAAFAAAVHRFESAVQAAGVRLAARYDEHAAALRAAEESYAATDSASGDELGTTIV